MTEIAKPYDVTPEAIAARRAAGPYKVNKGEAFGNITEEALTFFKAIAPLGVALLMISACLFFTFIW